MRKETCSQLLAAKLSTLLNCFPFTECFPVANNKCLLASFKLKLDAKEKIFQETGKFTFIVMRLISFSSQIKFHDNFEDEEMSSEFP